MRAIRKNTPTILAVDSLLPTFLRAFSVPVLPLRLISRADAGYEAEGRHPSESGGVLAALPATAVGHAVRYRVLSTVSG